MRRAPLPDTVRVIRDTRDASADYFLPRERAAQLFEQGKLHWDVTNSAYCHPTSSATQQRLT